MRPKGEVAVYKKKTVERLVTLMTKYPIIGVVDMENLPAKQLQQIRSALKDKVVLWMAKKRLAKIAISQASKKVPGVEKLSEYLHGMPALIFTEDDPFVLAKILKKNQSNAPIKAGQKAPEDIVVKAGKTNFSPGPVIGQLGALGIKTSIQDGKIAIAADAVVVKEGQEVSEKAASMLSRLGIEPMKIGLQLVAVFENGEVITKDILYVDEQVYIDKILQASAEVTAL
ncbi:50S ribosomal protein L10, partial [Candidatus Woesearchaeota archaeon]|nr:50S ribosomal protein L10 [Candidatus Woesearchaeota archaeon]